MKDIQGKKICKGNILKDSDGRRYEVTEKDGELHVKSLFKDSGCGEYLLYQERINENEFVVTQ